MLRHPVFENFTIADRDLVGNELFCRRDFSRLFLIQYLIEQTKRFLPVKN
jgi:hypothetical protein